MKKTLIALLALSGMACASTITLSGDNAGTLVVHLNVETMQDIAGNGFGGAVDAIALFKYTGTWQNGENAALGVVNNGSSTSHVTGLYTYWEKATTVCPKNQQFSPTLANIFNSSTPWSSVEDITVAYSWNSRTGATPQTDIYAAISYLTKDGTIVTQAGSWIDQMQFSGTHYTMTATGIDLSDTYVASYENMTTAITSVDDIKATAEAALVPEPATATLSLLALAGLAARRRRH